MFLVIVLAIVAVTLAILLPVAQNRYTMSKWFGSTIATESFDTADPHYNSLGATQTVNSLNRVIPVTDPTGSNTNAQLQAAMSTPTPSPGGGGITGTKVSVVRSSAAVPGRNAIAAQAAFCEKQSGIGTCAMLDDPAFAGVCGVCIKNGTKSLDTTPGQWVGGLYINNDDRSIATTMKADPQPTAGGCPPGYFFLDRASCEKGVNRMQCADAGIAGGWSGPSAPLMDSKCASSTPGGPFVYDTKNRSFLANIRFIVPKGTGTTTVTLYRLGSDGGRGKQIGAMEVNHSKEVLLTTWEPVVEGDSLQLEVVQEFATHTKGTPEVYAVGRNGYSFTQNTAATMCKSLNSNLATIAQIEQEQGYGADWCFAAHVSNGPPRYPTQVTRDGCGSKGTNVYGTESDLRGATCFGIKPSVNDDYSSTNTTVMPFADKPSPRESRVGRIQRGVRGFLAQWENTYDQTNAYKTAIPFEKTLTSDSKRLGSFSSSGLIAAPRAADFPKFLSNQYWIWSGNRQTAIFRCKVPATFLPPVYAEDAAAVAGKPLLSQRSSLTAGKVSPCTTPPYSATCLISLFTAAGGDGAKGTLSPTIGGAAAIQELQRGSEDAISNYVSELVGIATSGVLPGGSLASRAVVNQAAMKLFGFEIASPCEEIVAGSDGSVGLLPKEAPISPECMDFLYRNAGKEGFEGSVKSTIPATYVSIGDRYSGIRKGEYGVTKRQLTATPFQTCTPRGTIAPLKGGQVDSKAVQKITSSTDGSIEGIQGFFNRIFQLANTDGSQDTLAACFGITLAPPPNWIEIASLGKWILDPGPNNRLTIIAVGDDNSVIGISPFAPSIWASTVLTGVYKMIPGTLIQIDAKSSTLCVGIGADNNVYQRGTNGWFRIGMRAKWVSIGSDGTIICVNNENGRLWRYLGRVDAWENIPGNGIAQISVGNRNIMWCVDVKDQIFKWNGSIWELIPGALTQVVVSSKGKVAGVNRQGNIWGYSTRLSDWKRIPGGATNISISESYMAITNSQSLIYYLKI